jgi:sugar lactone lactonase YvrE
MVVAESVVGSGAYTYDVLEAWANIPDGWDIPAAAVTVDSQDRVYCFNRSKERPIVVFDRDGNVLSSWGEGVFAFPHAIRIDEHDNLWTVDRAHGQALLFSPDGTLLRSIGTRGHRSDTGVPPDDTSSQAWQQITHGAGPFNLPADIAWSESGDYFIADGYGNARVHKFDPEGNHLFSWGEPGTAPVQFNLPHGIWVDPRGRVLVADRENDRVQIFDQQGNLLEIWPTELIGPAFFYVDADDIVYVPEHNAGMVSVLTLDGERLARWGDPGFRSCHGIWGDSHGDIYVVRPGAWGRARRIVKYVRRR